MSPGQFHFKYKTPTILFTNIIVIFYLSLTTVFKEREYFKAAVHNFVFKIYKKTTTKKQLMSTS